MDPGFHRDDEILSLRKFNRSGFVATVLSVIPAKAGIQTFVA
jgi:hypothetical protein